MSKKFFDYSLSSIVLLVVVSIFIYHNNDFFKLKKHNKNVDSLILDTIISIDTLVVNQVDSAIIKLENEKCEIEKRKKTLMEHKKKYKDSILMAEKLKQKEEMLKLKERYEKQLDNIPNYRGGDIDTLKVEVK